MEGHIFAGQGAQHIGMAAELLERSPEARRMFSEADKTLGWSLTQLCTTGSMEELTACSACQPAIYALSVVSYQARSLSMGNSEYFAGVHGGLSLGEWSALCCAGAISFTEGLKAVARRGQLMDECCRRNPGGMFAIIGAENAVVEEICQKNDIDIANFNCPGQLIISGRKEAVARAAEQLAPSALKVVQLEVAGAYHSRLMREAGDAFAEYLDSVEIVLPRQPLVHNLTGDFCRQDISSIKEALVRQIYSPVKWEQCARTIMAHCDCIHEYGPGKVLSGLLRRIDRRIAVESDNL